MFKPRTAAYVKQTGQLVFVDHVDEAARVAYCKELGSKGPKGKPKPFGFDDIVAAPPRRAISVIFG